MTKKTSRVTISDAYELFILSREAMYVTEGTLTFYKYHLQQFFTWLKPQSINLVNEIDSKIVRSFLSELRTQKNKTQKIYTKLSDSYIHSYARTIRTFLRFCYDEHHIDQIVRFDMPRIAKKHLSVLETEDLAKVLALCSSLRDKCIISLMVDTGLRLSEATSLNWQDIELQKGTVNVVKGKGRKYRLVACGTKTKTLLKKLQMEYGEEATGENPVFLTDDGCFRLTPRGLQQLIGRISEKSGIEFSAHSLRRTFARLALRSGMDLVYIQRLMGHESIETTRRYIQDLDDSDVIKAVKQFSPIDKFTR